MDSKGRVFVPSRWRQELGEGVVLTKGLERCLYVMASEKFERFAGQAEGMGLERRTSRAYSRVVGSGSAEETIDRQGRITIPPALREYAGLTKEVVLAGVLGRAEIWDRAAWNAYRTSAEGEYESIAEQLEGDQRNTGRQEE